MEGRAMVKGSLTLIMLLETFWLGVSFTPLIAAGVVLSHSTLTQDFPHEDELLRYSGTIFGLLLCFLIGQLTALLTYSHALRTLAPNWLLPYAAWRAVTVLGTIGAMIPIGTKGLVVEIGDYAADVRALAWPIMIISLPLSILSIAAVLRARQIWLSEAKADVDGWKVDIIGQVAFEVPGRGIGVLPQDNIFHTGGF